MDLARQTGDEITRQAGSHLACNDACALFRDLEMRRATNTIENVKVVGQHPSLKQASREVHENVGIVIDTSQQNALIQECDAGVAQSSARLPHVRSDFIRVVDVENENNRQADLAEPLGQSRIDAARKDNRLPRMDSKPP